MPLATKPLVVMVSPSLTQEAASAAVIMGFLDIGILPFPMVWPDAGSLARRRPF